MWIFLNDAFLSIVTDRNSAKLLVRARLPGDIERVFPGAKVAEDMGTDYRFRAWIERETVADTLHHAVTDINYSNFKNSVQNHTRHDAYRSVWNVMHRTQEKARQHAGSL